MLGVCVEERQGGYHFNPQSTRYSDSVFMNDMIRWYLDGRTTLESQRRQTQPHQGD
ncbi:MAG: hypothetical protein HYW22_01490 [Candidatus Aenigmarchaeota archaeon]|nr:hypothetical protein [Candidatus Aenigmarchaeota archaeon]